jgi:hypothetical protein
MIATSATSKKKKNLGILPPIKVGDFSVLSRTGMD